MTTNNSASSRHTTETVLTLQFHYEIARALAGAASLEDAFSAVLEKIATYGGWDATAAWLTHDLPMGPRSRWVGPRMPSSALDDGAALVQQVLETGQPAWQSGQRSTLAFPLLGDDNTLGAIELVRTGPYEPEEHARQIFTVLSQDIGQFVARHDPHRQAWRDVMYDRQTGLATPELLIERGNQALLMAERTGHGLTLAIIRLRAAGDLGPLLPGIVQRLSGKLRPYDTVAIMAPHELAVLFPAQNANDDNRTLEEKIRKLLPLFALDGARIKLHADASFAAYPADGIDVPSLLRHARGQLESDSPRQFV